MSMRKIKRIVIHHSAGRDRPKVDFFSIRDWHVSGRGWSDCGYHLVVEEAEGRPLTVLGRPLSRMGAHAKGANKDSIGICLVGIEDFSPGVMRQLGSLVDQMREVFRVQRSQVFGHREVGTTATDCPGRKLMAWVRRYRARA